MKRPLAFFGFTLFSVLLCINLIESTAVSVCLTTLSAIAFVFSLINKKSRQSLYLPVISAAVIMGCLLMLLFSSYYESVLTYSGEDVYVEGVIAEKPYFSRENERNYCVIKVSGINSEKVITKMRVSFSEKDEEIDSDCFVIGDKISFRGTVYKTGSENTDIRRYYKSQGIYLGAYSLEDISFTESGFKPIGYYIDILRHKVTENLLHDFDGDIASFLVAILTGSKEYMSDSIYDDFVRAGVVHIMAVSGLHLSVWVAFLSIFIDFKGRKGKIMAVFMIIFTVFMMNFACFTGSVKRAAAMTVLHFIGKLIRRKSDSLNSLGFAAVCALLPSPYAVFDISFLLSFLSTMGIIVLGIPSGKKLTDKIRTKKEKLRKLVYPFVLTFMISVSVGIFTFPVSVYYFGGFSLAAPFTNILFMFTVSPLLVMTGVYSFVRFIPFLSPLFAIVIKHLSLYMLKVAERIASLDFSYFSIRTPELKIVFGIAFLILVFAFISYKYDRFLCRLLTIIASGIIILSVISDYGTQLKCRVEIFEGCAVVSYLGHGVLIGFEGDIYDEEEVSEFIGNQELNTDCVILLSEIISKSQQSISHRLGTKNILTADGTSVTLYGKINIEKSDNTVKINTDEIKTYIFYQEPLQEDAGCDIINRNNSIDGMSSNETTEFSVGKKNPFSLIVKGENIEIRGEMNWLNMMKKVLKVT